MRTLRDLPRPSEYCLEIAQSHDGSLGYVLAMLDALSKRGAKLVKFQMHLPEFESTSKETFRVAFSNQDKTRTDYWMRTGFKISEWQIIKEKCDELALEFLCTPVSPQAVEILEDLSVYRYKIASADLTNGQLLKVVAATKKPVILSTGMATISEIQTAVGILESIDLTLLQCTSKYPSSIEEVGVNVIHELQELFPNLSVGLSDHTGNINVAMWAVALGASFIEQHVVFSKEQFGPDTASSVDLADVEAMMKFMHVGDILLKSIVEKDKIALALQELRALFGRGLAPLRNIEKGELITAEILTLKKPVGPLGWDDLDRIIGRRAIRNIRASEHIQQGDYE